VPPCQLPSALKRTKNRFQTYMPGASAASPGSVNVVEFKSTAAW